MIYHVKNIKFENNVYKTKLPIEFSDSHWLGKVYLRSELFQNNDITYDIEPVIDYVYYTHHTAPQPYNLDILRTFNKYVDVNVTLSYRDNLVVFIPNDYDKHYDSLELAVFDRLTDHFDVDFFYTESGRK